MSGRLWTQIVCDFQSFKLLSGYRGSGSLPLFHVSFWSKTISVLERAMTKWSQVDIARKPLGISWRDHFGHADIWQSNVNWSSSDTWFAPPYPWQNFFSFHKIFLSLWKPWKYVLKLQFWTFILGKVINEIIWNLHMVGSFTILTSLTQSENDEKLRRNWTRKNLHFSLYFYLIFPWLRVRLIPRLKARNCRKLIQTSYHVL